MSFSKLMLNPLTRYIERPFIVQSIVIFAVVNEFMAKLRGWIFAMIRIDFLTYNKMQSSLGSRTVRKSMLCDQQKYLKPVFQYHTSITVLIWCYFIEVWSYYIIIEVFYNQLCHEFIFDMTYCMLERISRSVEQNEYTIGNLNSFFICSWHNVKQHFNENNRSTWTKRVYLRSFEIRPQVNASKSTQFQSKI